MIPLPRKPFLQIPISAYPGFGPVKTGELAKRGLLTNLDMLLLPPAGYQDRRGVSRLAEKGENEEGLFCLRTLGTRYDHRKKYFQAVMTDGDDNVALWWFNAGQYFEDKFRTGSYFYCFGAVKYRGRAANLYHPEIQPASEHDFDRGRLRGGMGDPGGRPFEEASERQSRDRAAGGVPARPSPLGVTPFYRPIGTLNPQARRALMEMILDRLPAGPPAFLPEACLKKHRLKDPLECLRTIHRPPSDCAGPLPAPWQTRAHKNLRLLEMAFWRLVVLLARPPKIPVPPGGAGPAVWNEDRARAAAAGLAASRFWEAMPFEASPEQTRACAEILADIASPRPMSRLLQGEVGCGKTAVAGAAAAAALSAGGQAALMAPTEILARQHHDFFKKHEGALGGPVYFLTGGLPAGERRRVLEALAAGGPSLTVGTHALARPAAVFQNLTLAVVDEQHRFGVRQRLALRQKSRDVDLLAMSATPIPGSLAAILYADTDVSSMTGVLPGRSAPETVVHDFSEAEQAYRRLADLVARGEQAFVVCPRIESDKDDGREDPEEKPPAPRPAGTASIFRDLDGYSIFPAGAAMSAAGPGGSSSSGGPPPPPPVPAGPAPRPEVAKVAAKIRALLPRAKIGSLHGRLAPEKRDEAVRGFRDGSVRVLVATTMVEVGVDVPAANVMLVAGAEYFGLAQLHQLRGRVGRGGGRGVFLLLPAGEPSPVARERFKAIEESHDGYALAEKDLELRGPGEELGLRQSGWPRMDAARLPRDLPLLPRALELAKDLLDCRDSWEDDFLQAVLAAKDELSLTETDPAPARAPTVK
ncbi:MAG: DEAD/DEAH box helicase [Deltaproteobacteria bacterium]|jgi:ATP-dependent DNA helicase RecG|nr:DEAD/DEAH box helicase [Deltaproteobacteria bacterium]